MQTKWPTTQDALKTVGEVNTVDQEEVDACRLAAIDWIEQHCISFHVDPDDDESALQIPDSVYRATIMLTHRLFKRRESAEGVAGFGDMGAVRVSTIDHDIENLLSAYRAWGIA